MKIALPTLVNTGLTPRGRRSELVELVSRVVAGSDADLCVLPELSVCGYPALTDPEGDQALLDQVSEPVDGPSGKAFRAAATTSGCTIVYGISEQPPEGGPRFNTLVMAQPDGTLTGYRKVHLTPEERQYWAPGAATGLVSTSDGVVGMSACNDKAFADIYAAQRAAGARLSVICSAWSSHRGSSEVSGDVWAEQSELFDRARAAETGMVVVSTNYRGPKVPGGAESFCDGRRVVDPLGRLLPADRQDGVGLFWEVDLDAATAVVDRLHPDGFFGRQPLPRGRDTPDM